MIHSMTGFGKAEGLITNKKISILLKSLNSKQFDLIAKLPHSFKEKELDFRKSLSSSLGRGKVELILNLESQNESTDLKINTEVFSAYHKQLKTLAGDLGEKDTDLMSTISRLPDVIESKEETLSEEEWGQIEAIIETATKRLIDYRANEGRSLEDDLKGRIAAIQALLEQIPSYEAERITNVRERLMKNLNESGQKESINKERFEQELTYYLDKFDISEEKVRLESHCNYFLECMELEEKQGKKLGFISQEIGREINTLGSKSNHLEMQKIVVQMKDELEKIKEQVLNIC